MCRSIFAEVHVQSVPLRERLFVFEIFDILLSKYVKNLAKMGLDFVGGYLRGTFAPCLMSQRPTVKKILEFCGSASSTWYEPGLTLQGVDCEAL